MITVYGAPSICIDCRVFKNVIKNRKLFVEEVDILENTTNLKRFLQIRDTSKEFDEIRLNGKIGIPCFKNDDGRITLDPNIALSWLNEEPLKEEELLEKEEECEDCGNILLHKTRL